MQGQTHTAALAMGWRQMDRARMSGFRPPPGLEMPPSPRLDLPPPPGLDSPMLSPLRLPYDDADITSLLSVRLSTMRLDEDPKDCDLWESECSTAESSEVPPTLSRTSSAEKPVLKLSDVLSQSATPRVPGCAQRSPKRAAYEPGKAFTKASSPTLVLDLAGALGRGPVAAPPPPPPPPPAPRCDDSMLKLPSLGSALHALGRCRPCDFMYRNDNCREGAACSFCHLCGPQAVRQRRKQRRAVLRSGRQAVVSSASP